MLKCKQRQDFRANCQLWAAIKAKGAKRGKEIQLFVVAWYQTFRTVCVMILSQVKYAKILLLFWFYLFKFYLKRFVLTHYEFVRKHRKLQRTSLERWGFSLSNGMRHVFLRLLVPKILRNTFQEIFFETNQFFVHFWLLCCSLEQKSLWKPTKASFSTHFPCRGVNKRHFEVLYRGFHENH